MIKLNESFKNTDFIKIEIGLILKFVDDNFQDILFKFRESTKIEILISFLNEFSKFYFSKFLLSIKKIKNKDFENLREKIGNDLTKIIECFSENLKKASSEEGLKLVSLLYNILDPEPDEIAIQSEIDNIRVILKDKFTFEIFQNILNLIPNLNKDLKNRILEKTKSLFDSKFEEKKEQKFMIKNEIKKKEDEDVADDGFDMEKYLNDQLKENEESLKE